MSRKSWRPWSVLQHRYGSAPILWRALMLASLATAPSGLSALSDSTWDLRAVAAAVAVGAMGTGLAYVAVATLSGRVGGTRSAVVTYVATPVAVVLGVGLRGESVAVTSIIGVVAALAGAYLASGADRPGRGQTGQPTVDPASPVAERSPT